MILVQPFDTSSLVALTLDMTGAEKDGSGQPPALKPSKITQLKGDQFIKLGLVKGSIANTKKTITSCLKEIEKIKVSVENVAAKRKDLTADSFYVKSNIYSILNSKPL